MRLLGKVAIGGVTVASVTVGALLAGGVFATSAAPPPRGLGAAPARPVDLVSFDDCAGLRNWYVQNNLSEVGPYGWAGPVVYLDDITAFDGAPMPNVALAETVQHGASDMGAARTSSSTGTNVQEAGVDEPDVAKTDGKIVVRLTRPQNAHQVLEVVDVTGAQAVTLGRLQLPVASYDSQLLLAGDHVVVTQADSGPGNRLLYADGPMRYRPVDPATRVLDIDVSDPTTPRLVRTDVYTGTLISARQYGDTIRLVTDTGRPQLKWRTPGKHVTAAEATAYNKNLVRESAASDWLPSVRHAGHAEPLLSCAQVLRPEIWSGSDTIAVTTFTAGAPTNRSAVGITASGGIVYSSASRLYVASTAWDPLDWRGDPAVGRERATPAPVITDLHAFELTTTGTRYLASGVLNATVRDRWSLDEHDGDLRVAWTTHGRGSTQNGISIFREQEQNHSLDEIGTLDRLGVNEDIQSVRWFGDLALAVTFRKTDPLYTIDLSDPYDPRTLGVLKTPGYSGYLHPIGDDLVLGLGADGSGSGGKAATFDLSHLRSPRQVADAFLGADTDVKALADPRAFTWLPDLRTGLVPVADWSTLHPSRLLLVALKVEKDGELTVRTIAHLGGDWEPRTLPLDHDRVAVVEIHRVRLIDLGS